MPVEQNAIPGLADDLRRVWPHADGGPATTDELLLLAQSLQRPSGGQPARQVDGRLLGAALHRHPELFALEADGRWVVLDPVIERERRYYRGQIPDAATAARRAANAASLRRSRSMAQLEPSGPRWPKRAATDPALCGKCQQEPRYRSPAGVLFGLCRDCKNARQAELRRLARTG
jgi:hypothetical protein